MYCELKILYFVNRVYGEPPGKRYYTNYITSINKAKRFILIFKNNPARDNGF